MEYVIGYKVNSYIFFPDSLILNFIISKTYVEFEPDRSQQLSITGIISNNFGFQKMPGSGWIKLWYLQVCSG